VNKRWRSSCAKLVLLRRCPLRVLGFSATRRSSGSFHQDDRGGW
ncbi:unnamed protein product, partial [Ectocarpus fasciculatus]